jgi:hypothetical protein
MDKYLVGEVGVIDDAGLIDWARFKNKPSLVAGVNGTTRSEVIGSGSEGAITYYVEDDGTGKARLVERTTFSNCNCNDCGC